MAIRNTLEPHVSPHHVTGLEDAEAFLTHRFADRHLLAQALTHRSAVGAGGAGSNERLEFIGDRVLGLVVAEWLLERFPDEREGDIGKRLAALVSEPSLVAVAEAHGVAAFIQASKGEAKRGVRERATVLADALEAMIGALYLDAGLAPAKNFIRRVLGDVVDKQALPPKDPKTALQEWALARALALPLYEVVAQSGPSHNPHFTIRVTVADAAATGHAGSKRAAEQEAAATLLGMLPA
jgi:ribonuclease-3